MCRTLVAVSVRRIDNDSGGNQNEHKKISLLIPSNLMMAYYPALIWDPCGLFMSPQKYEIVVNYLIIFLILMRVNFLDLLMRVNFLDLCLINFVLQYISRF